MLKQLAEASNLSDSTTNLEPGNGPDCLPFQLRRVPAPMVIQAANHCGQNGKAKRRGKEWLHGAWVFESPRLGDQPIQ